MTSDTAKKNPHFFILRGPQIFFGPQTYFGIETHGFGRVMLIAFLDLRRFPKLILLKKPPKSKAQINKS